MTHVPFELRFAAFIASRVGGLEEGTAFVSPVLQHPRRNLLFGSWEKLQFRTTQLCHGICILRLPFKFFRRTVAQRRMQSLSIVVSFDKFLDVAAQVIEI